MAQENFGKNKGIFRPLKEGMRREKIEFYVAHLLTTEFMWQIKFWGVKMTGSREDEL